MKAKQDRRGVGRAIRWIVLGLWTLLWTLFCVACGNPDREILAVMSEAEQARFLAGRQVAVKCWTCHDLAGTVKISPRASNTAREFETANPTPITTRAGKQSTRRGQSRYAACWLTR